MSERRAYPLYWPDGWKRTPPSARKRASFGTAGRGWNQTQQRDEYQGKNKLSVADALARISREMDLLNVAHHRVIVSTNIPTRLDGLPRSDRAEPQDPGAAVYWSQRGTEKCMAIDRYDRVADNLAGIAATLEAFRAIERHGGGEILERSFQGLAALPMPAGRGWREVLGFSPNVPVSADTVEAAYKSLVRVRHPDANGGSHDSHEAFIELSQARDQALRELR